MTNDELETLMINRKAAQASLKKTLAGLSGFKPMDLLSGGLKNLEGLAAQIESVTHLNDVAVTELVERSINNG